MTNPTTTEITTALTLRYDESATAWDVYRLDRLYLWRVDRGNSGLSLDAAYAAALRLTEAGHLTVVLAPTGTRLDHLEAFARQYDRGALHHRAADAVIPRG